MGRKSKPRARNDETPRQVEESVLTLLSRITCEAGVTDSLEFKLLKHKTIGTVRHKSERSVTFGVMGLVPKIIVTVASSTRTNTYEARGHLSVPRGMSSDEFSRLLKEAATSLQARGWRNAIDETSHEVVVESMVVTTTTIIEKYTPRTNASFAEGNGDAAQAPSRWFSWAVALSVIIEQFREHHATFERELRAAREQHTTILELKRRLESSTNTDALKLQALDNLAQEAVQLEDGFRAKSEEVLREIGDCQTTVGMKLKPHMTRWEQLELIKYGL